MKFWSLLLWVTHFGFSVIFPSCFFLITGNWLKNHYGLGSWVMILAGAIGLLTTVSTVRSCVKALRKEADLASSDQTPPTAFNDHQ